MSIAILAGLAGLWVWTVLNDDEGIAGPLTRLLRKNDITQKWMECPWCSGAWFAIIATLPFTIPDGSVFPAIVIALAASAITGMLGSYLQGE